MKIQSELSFSYAHIQFDGDCAVRILVPAGHHVTAKECGELHQLIANWSQQRSLNIYIIADDLRCFSKEALHFVSGPGILHVRNTYALIVQSCAQRITGNFYLKLNPMTASCAIFNDEISACSWSERQHLHLLEVN